MSEYRKQGSSVYRDTGRREEFCGREWLIVQRYAGGTALVEAMRPEQWEKLEHASAADWKAGEKEHAKLVAQKQYKRDIEAFAPRFVWWVDDRAFPAGRREIVACVVRLTPTRIVDARGRQFVRETGKQYPASHGSLCIPKTVLAQIEREAGGRERVDFVKERAKAARVEQARQEDEENTAETEREMLADFIAAREEGDA